MNESLYLQFRKWVGFPASYVNLSEGKSKWNPPSWVSFLEWGIVAETRFRWARSRTHGSYGHGGDGDTKIRMNRRSFDVFFNCELIGKTHPTPKKIKGRMKWRLYLYFPKVVERYTVIASAVCLWLFGVTSWFKCTRAEGRTLYLYWIFQTSQDYGRWAVIKTLLICCIWGIILPSYNIGLI